MLRLNAIALSLGLAAVSQAQTATPITLQLEQVATGLTNIVEISHCGDERLFLTLRAGVIRILDGNGVVLPTPFLDISGPVLSTGGEQGMLGLAFPPDYATSGFFYVYYIAGSGNGISRISRFSVSDANPNVADPASEQIIYSRSQPYTNHNGGAIHFGPDGYLYIGFGDGGSGGDPQNYAQNLTNALGDMIRIDVSDPDTTYTIPPTNPWVDLNNDTLPEIWASGLRNPWRWGFDALTGDLWIGDVGQDLVEEVDYWPATNGGGANFGWRCYEGNSAYNTGGCAPQNTYVAPVTTHTHSSGWCSVIGGRVYRGDTYWRIDGAYVYTDYCDGRFYTLVPNGLGGFTRTLVLTSQFGFSCIGENSALELYAGNTETGVLWKIKERCSMAAPVISEDGSVLTGVAPDALTTTWYRDGVAIPNATDLTYTVTGTGTYRLLTTYAGGCQLVSNSIFIGFAGLEDANAAKVTLQPNPADDVLIIDGMSPPGGFITLTDAAGRVALTMNTATAGPMTVPVSRLSNGAYVVSVFDTEGTLTLRRPVMVRH